jgi:RHS repeat-associated protein
MFVYLIFIFTHLYAAISMPDVMLKHSVDLATGRLQMSLPLSSDPIVKRLQINPLFISGDGDSVGRSTWRINQVAYLECGHHGFINLYDPQLAKITLKKTGNGNYVPTEVQDRGEDTIYPGQIIYSQIRAKRYSSSYILSYPDKTILYFKHVGDGRHLLNIKQMPDKSCFFYTYDNQDLKSVSVAKHIGAETKSIVYTSQFKGVDKRQFASGMIQGAGSCLLKWSKERLTRVKDGFIDSRPYVLSVARSSANEYKMSHERFRPESPYQLTQVHGYGHIPIDIGYHEDKANDFLGRPTYMLRADWFQIDKVRKISSENHEALYFDYNRDGEGRITTVYGPCGKKEEHFFDENKLLKKVRFYKDDELYYELHYCYEKRANLNLLVGVYYIDECGGCITFLEYEYNDELLLSAKVENGLRVSYTYDACQRVSSICEPCGLVRKFEYLGDSSLITTELFCDVSGVVFKRNSFRYDDNFQKVLEIIDSGSDDGIRLIKKIKPHEDPRFLGQPLEVQEGFFDRQKSGFSLLKRDEFEYKTTFGPSLIRSFNANNDLLHEKKMSYEPGGKISSLINEKGHETTYLYDKMARLIVEKDLARKKTTQFSYNATNCITQKQIVYADGYKELYTYTYDDAGRCIVQNEPNGCIRQFSYDRFDRKIKEVFSYNEKSVVFEKEFDFWGNIISKSRDGIVFESSTYNNNQQLVKREFLDGSVESYVYNDCAVLERFVDRLGVETRYCYDVLTRETKKQMYSKQGGLFREIVKEYDGLELKRDVDGSSVQVYEYDDAARVVSLEKNGVKTSYLYDENNHLYAKTIDQIYEVEKKDVFGRIIEKKMCDREKNLFRHLSFTYDTLDHIIKRVIHGDSKDILEEFSFDSRDRLVLKRDGYGDEIKIYYSDVGQCREINYPDKRVLKESFDALGNLIASEHSDSSGRAVKKQAYLYDLLGNKLSDLDFRIEGNKTQIERTLYRYDIEGRVKSVVGPFKDVAYDYYPDGQIKTVFKADGVRVDYQRDARALLSRVQSSDGTIGYELEYDESLRLTHAKDLVAGFDVSRSYDSFGNVQKEVVLGLPISYSYDEMGRAQRLELFDKSSIEYHFNPYFLKQIIRVDAQGSIVYRHTYNSFDKSGKLKSESLIGGLGCVEYEYDLLERLKRVSSEYHNFETLRLSSSNQVVSLKESDAVHTFSYDALGQMSSCRAIKCQFDSCYHKVEGGNRPIFDQAHRMISCDKRTFTYDAKDRLIEVRGDEYIVRYGYDFFDRRVKKEVFDLEGNSLDEQIYYYWDLKEIGSVKKGQFHSLRVLGVAKEGDIAGAVALELAGQVFAPLHDLMGSIRGVVSIEDGSTESYSYDEFARGVFSEAVSPWLYSSKRVDREAGLIFFSRRYYDPSLQRFITPDPKPMQGVNNPYIFSFNNPLSFYDAWGLENKASGFQIALDALNFFVSGPSVSEVFICAGIENMGYNSCLGREPSMQVSSVGNGDSLGDARAFYINGIQTSQIESQMAAQWLSSSIDHSVTCVYNTSRSLKEDVIGLVINKFHVMDMPIVRGLKRQLQVAIKDGAPRIYLFAHSEGGVIAKNALQAMHQDQRDMVHLYTFGSPTIVDKSYASSVTNFYSTRDYSVILSTFNFVSSYFTKNKFDIEFIPSSNEMFVDHYIMGSTYKNKLEHVASNISLNYGK